MEIIWEYGLLNYSERCNELWEMNGEFLESKYIDEVEPIEEIRYDTWWVKMDGEYCKLSYM